MEGKKKKKVDLRSFMGETYGFVDFPQQQQPAPYSSPSHSYNHPNHPHQFNQPSNEFSIKENGDRNIFELAEIFLNSYYQLWATGPQYLYRFHGEDTDFTHGEEGNTVTGLDQIKKRLAELNYHKDNNIAEINFYDVHAAVNKSVYITIVGKMVNFEGPYRPFTQLLVLNLTPFNSKKYYVRTDLFKYLDLIFPFPDFLNSLISPPPPIYNYEQFQPPPPPYPYSHDPNMYGPETVEVAFAPCVFGQIPHLYQPQPQPQLNPQHFPSSSVSLSGEGLNEMNIPPTHPVTVEDNNVNQIEIINDENNEKIDQQNMNSMIHTNNEAVACKQNEVLLKHGSQMAELDTSFQLMNLSKPSSISYTSLPSLALPTFKLVNSPPPSSELKIMDNKDIREKQHKDVQIEEKKQEQLIPDAPSKPNNLTKERKSGTDYKYNNTFGKKSVLSYKDNLLYL